MRQITFLALAVLDALMEEEMTAARLCEVIKERGRWPKDLPKDAIYTAVYRLWWVRLITGLREGLYRLTPEGAILAARGGERK